MPPGISSNAPSLRWLRRALRRATPWALSLAAAIAPRAARALDKQGSAHGGAVSAGGLDDDAFDVSGALTLGTAVVNPSYAARPDNTGLALMRYAAHADVDAVGRKLSIPLDVNLFSDRTRRGAGVFDPSELDVIGGLTTTRPVGPGDFELGARVEHDRPVDRGLFAGGQFTQTYADVRARYLYSLRKIAPSVGRDLVDGDLSGWGTLGWFAINPSYAARPDNSGLALFRYTAHTELSVWHDHMSLGVDGTFFTDRRVAALRPSECDLTYEVIGRDGVFEMHLAYERDMPVDRGGLVQSFVYALLVYDFDLRRDVLEPLESRSHIPSP